MSEAAIKMIFKPFDEGRAMTVLNGRPVCDLTSDGDMNIVTLNNLLCNFAYDKHNMAHIRYCLATGVLIPEQMYGDDIQKINIALTEVGIIDAKCNYGECNATQKFIDDFKGILRLSSEPKFLDLKWTDGRPLRFMFQYEFSSHLIPNGQTINQFIANELAYIAAHSTVIRNSANYIVFSDVVEGMIEPMVSDVIPNITLEYPGYDDKLEVLQVLHDRYPNARYEEGLDDNQVANLSSNSPNIGLEGLFWGSDRSGSFITVAQLIEQKIKDVAAISEGTLIHLDIERVKDVELVGATIEVPKNFLMDCAKGLRSKNKLTPMNILLLGAPSTGKTDLAMMTASLANIPAYGLSSPKNSFVGETEKRSKLQMNILKSMSPNLGFIDEITEAYSNSMERSGRNFDSGASAAVTAALLESLSDKSREGNSILIATSNRGWAIGGAMLSRFTPVPMLMPVETDYHMIIQSIVKNISSGEFLTDISDERVLEAAKIFYTKDLMPRNIRNALKHSMSIHKALTPEEILWAANDAVPMDFISRCSSIYSDYYALRLCFSKSLLPWNGNPDFPFPLYIKMILDDNGEIDAQKLNEEMDKLRPYVNV